MTNLYRLRESRGWKDDDYIDQLRNSGVLIPVTMQDVESIIARRAFGSSLAGLTAGTRSQVANAAHEIVGGGIEVDR